MSPSNNLNYLITHLAAVITKQSDQLLQEQLGIGLSQYRILMVLEWNPHVPQKTIADTLGQTEASISRQVKLLQKSGLLKSKPDPNNKRKHQSLPTALGMQVTEAANDLLKRTQAADLESIGEDNLSKLASSLAEVHALVCRPGKTGSCDHLLGSMGYKNLNSSFSDPKMV
jgi:DNA-binding MarR family transcriptional regulator